MCWQGALPCDLLCFVCHSQGAGRTKGSWGSVCFPGTQCSAGYVAVAAEKQNSTRAGARAAPVPAAAAWGCQALHARWGLLGLCFLGLEVCPAFSTPGALHEKIHRNYRAGQRTTSDAEQEPLLSTRAAVRGSCLHNEELGFCCLPDSFMLFCSSEPQSSQT